MSKTIYVNQSKKDRAEDIVAMLIGKKVPSDANETSLAERYGRVFKDEGIDPKKDGAVKFVYEKLGGLMRTEDEEKNAKVKKAEMQKKGKKDRFGIK